MTTDDTMYMWLFAVTTITNGHDFAKTAFATADVAATFVRIAPRVGQPAVAYVWSSGVAILAECDDGKKVFSSAEAASALEQVAKHATSKGSAKWWLQAVKNIKKHDPAVKIFEKLDPLIAEKEGSGCCVTQ